MSPEQVKTDGGEPSQPISLPSLRMPVADDNRAVGAQQEDAGQSTAATGPQEDGEQTVMSEVQIQFERRAEDKTG